MQWSNFSIKVERKIQIIFNYRFNCEWQLNEWISRLKLPLQNLHRRKKERKKSKVKEINEKIQGIKFLKKDRNYFKVSVRSAPNTWQTAEFLRAAGSKHSKQTAICTKKFSYRKLTTVFLVTLYETVAIEEVSDNQENGTFLAWRLIAHRHLRYVSTRTPIFSRQRQPLLRNCAHFHLNLQLEGAKFVQCFNLYSTFARGRE